MVPPVIGSGQSPVSAVVLETSSRVPSNRKKAVLELSIQKLMYFFFMLS